jgi:hypothetical protein
MNNLSNNDFEGRIAQLEQKLQILSGKNLELSDRLDREQRRARARFYIFFALVLLGILSALTSRATKSFNQVDVEAERFVLRDKSGRTRAILQITDDSPEFAFYDRKGKNRLTIYSNSDGRAGIQVFDSNETNRLLVGCDRNGESGLAIYDREGKISIQIPEPMSP